MQLYHFFNIIFFFIFRWVIWKLNHAIPTVVSYVIVFGRINQLICWFQLKIWVASWLSDSDEHHHFQFKTIQLNSTPAETLNYSLNSIIHLTVSFKWLISWLNWLNFSGVWINQNCLQTFKNRKSLFHGQISCKILKKKKRKQFIIYFEVFNQQLIVHSTVCNRLK